MSHHHAIWRAAALTAEEKNAMAHSVWGEVSASLVRFTLSFIYYFIVVVVVAISPI